MGLCLKCKQFLPPDFMMTKEKKCHFCERDNTTIFTSDGKMWIKEDVVKDYKELLDMLKDNPEIQKEMLKSAVKNEVK